MKELYLKALKAYLEMLEIHIDTKTKDYVFHKATEEMYEKLFETAHKIGERYVDLDGELRKDSLEEKKKRANEIIAELAKEINKFTEKNEISAGCEDLLGTLANDLEDLAGTGKAFLPKGK